MFIKLQRSDGTPFIVNINTINSVVYQDPTTSILYTDRNQFTLNISYEDFIQKLIKYNIEID